MMQKMGGSKHMMDMVGMHEKKAHRLAMGESAMKINDPVTTKNLGHGRYRVSTPGGVKAKSTTKGKAKKQANLLRGIEHGWKPTGKA